MISSLAGQHCPLPCIEAACPFSRLCVLSVLACVGGVYLFYFFPETKGKSLEEVEQDFHVRTQQHGQQSRSLRVLIRDCRT